jgi:hypothetical protein
MYTVYSIHILHVIKNMYIQYIQGLSQSRLSTTDHALSLVAPVTMQSSNLNGCMLDCSQI